MIRMINAIRGFDPDIYFKMLARIILPGKDNEEGEGNVKCRIGKV